jgi:fluoride exporter
MDKILIIGLGGGLGSIFRYLLSTFTQEKMNNASFPFGTMVVNITGCFIIGVLSYLSDVKGIINSEMRTFLFIGLLGGFTTFSTFSNESVGLLRNGEFINSLLNISVQIFLGLFAVIIGRLLGQLFWR